MGWTPDGDSCRSPRGPRPQSKLGEGALWDATRGVVWFVDIKRHRLWHFDPATGSNAFAEAHDQIGWALPAEGGLLLCGLGDGLYTFDPDTQRFEKLAAVPGEPAGNRLNDACTDPWGRVWFRLDGRFRGGRERALLRVRPRRDPPRRAERNLDHQRPDGERLGRPDLFHRHHRAEDRWSPTSARPGSARRGCSSTPARCFPTPTPTGRSSMPRTIVWTGLYLGAKVARFSPDGKLAGTVTMPARDITKMTLGGADLKTAYVATATKNMDEAAFANFPPRASCSALPRRWRGRRRPGEALLTRRGSFGALVLAGALLPATALAAPQLDAAWSDHVVVQRGQPIRVEGTAAPGENSPPRSAAKARALPPTARDASR